MSYIIRLFYLLLVIIFIIVVQQKYVLFVYILLDILSTRIFFYNVIVKTLFISTAMECTEWKICFDYQIMCIIISTKERTFFGSAIVVILIENTNQNCMTVISHCYYSNV